MKQKKCYKITESVAWTEYIYIYISLTHYSVYRQQITEQPIHSARSYISFSRIQHSESAWSSLEPSQLLRHNLVLTCSALIYFWTSCLCHNQLLILPGSTLPALTHIHLPTPHPTSSSSQNLHTPIQGISQWECNDSPSPHSPKHPDLFPYSRLRPGYTYHTQVESTVCMSLHCN